MNKNKLLIGSLMLFLTFGMSTPTWSAITYDETAGTCAGGSGEMFIGVDGEKYCRSNVQMNWWSAFAWCEGAGGKLVPLDRCNGKKGDITGNVACPNFNGKNTSNCWTSSVPNSAKGYHLSSGAINSTNSRDSANVYALCE